MAEPAKDATDPPRIHKLEPEQELRFEVEFKDSVTVKLKSGLAEIFGTELAPDLVYQITRGVLNPENISGRCAVEYAAGETPMHSYLNAHVALEQLREIAIQTETQ
ncbi:hypothetical protein HDU67_003486, partial [Dinochytrium kinnereticum]